VICQINKLQLLPLGLCFTCFRDSPELTESLSTVTATLAGGFTKTNWFATKVDLSIESSQRISQQCKNASALYEKMIETVTWSVRGFLVPSSTIISAERCCRRSALLGGSVVPAWYITKRCDVLRNWASSSVFQFGDLCWTGRLDVRILLPVDFNDWISLTLNLLDVAYSRSDSQ